jgi:uncharacterized repeat protein (TIGR03806 family)
MMARGAFAFALLLLLALSPGPEARARAGAVNMAAILSERPAATLSDYGLFLDPGAREPGPALTRYDLNTPLYSDDAAKVRYVFTPAGKAARYRPDGVLDFPVGSVLVKTFAFPADMRRPDRDIRFLETRLLIHKASGWVALPYVWNEAQTQARLSLIGANLDARWIDGAGALQQVAWAVPNKNQCKGCHALDEAVTPIGPKARNLNGLTVQNGQSTPQLPLWVARGHLDRAPEDAPRVARFDDPSAPLDARARAYLDVNCGHCHNPRGPASNSGLSLTIETQDPHALGVFKRPVATGRGTGDFQFSIKPGAPEQSILLHRMQSAEPGVMMPELGRTRTHGAGVTLIQEWIAAMDQDGRQKTP